MKISNFLQRFFPAPKPVERRESERSALSLPIQILAQEEAWEATMVEMSDKGARIHLREELEPGQSLRIQFRPGEIRLAAHCRWARRAGRGWLAGLQFDS
ncbi:MAG: PilZ domain-containing protein [Candidatus Eremiobacteraeota bacterium]|nr:PilZ domain-containing protein [Candidatus Eremiobacteraeota bacterium]